MGQAETEEGQAEAKEGQRSIHFRRCAPPPLRRTAWRPSALGAFCPSFDAAARLSGAASWRVGAAAPNEHEAGAAGPPLGESGRQPPIVIG
jgi:hypothetical protein